jgi:hypothetical protein
MGQIYRRTSRTVIHLGAPLNNGGIAFRALEVLSKLHDQVEAGSLAISDVGLKLYPELYDQVSAGNIKTPNIPEGFMQCFIALHDALVPLITELALAGFCLLPWFTRTWVLQVICSTLLPHRFTVTNERSMQEVSLCKNAIVVCGQNETAWEALAKGLTLHMIRRAPMPALNLTPYAHASILKFIALHKRARSQGQDFDLLSLLNNVRRFKATGDRDKVYGILSLTTSDLGIRPDYSISRDELYTNVAVAIINNSGNLDLLSVPHSPSLFRRRSLSWVPNWGDRLLFPRSLLECGKRNMITSTFKAFCASGEPVLSKIRITTSAVDGRTKPNFVIRGFVFDRVDSLSTLCPDATFSNLENDVLIKNYDGSINLWRCLASLPRWNVTVYRRCIVFLAALRSWRSFLKKNSFYLDSTDSEKRLYAPTGERLADAFVRIFTADTMLPGDNFRTTKLWRWMPSRQHGLWADSKYYGISTLESQSSGARCREATVICLGRRLGSTKNGYFGLLPAGTRKGDAIVLAEGGRVPLVLREVKSKKSWELVGDCYIHGIMYGEAFDSQKCGEMLMI